MLTPSQQLWISHLSNDHTIEIKPYDPKTSQMFQTIKLRIQKEIGRKYPIELHGATKMKISGQGDIDVYIPVEMDRVRSLIAPLTKLFGEPRSIHEYERVRFVIFPDDTMVEIFIINKRSSGWIDSLKFEQYLMTHPEDLKKYEKLKETFHGRGGQDYYRAKLEFINEILSNYKPI